MSGREGELHLKLTASTESSRLDLQSLLGQASTNYKYELDYIAKDKLRSAGTPLSLSLSIRLIQNAVILIGEG